jgi:hypothetical protein
MSPELAGFTTEAAKAIDELRADRTKADVDQTEFTAKLTAIRQATREESGRAATGPFLEIGLPWAEAKLKEMSGEAVKLEALEVYQRRSASLVIDGYPDSTRISVIDVRYFRGFGFQRRCFPGVTGCGSMKDPKEETIFETALGSDTIKDLRLANADITSTPPPTQGGGQAVAKGVDNWKKILSACANINNTARRLGLSTIDSLLVRWALLEDEVDLTTKLIAYQDWEARMKQGIDAKTPGAPPHAAALTAAMEGNRLDIKCWSAIDKNKLNDIEHVMGNKFISN